MFVRLYGINDSTGIQSIWSEQYLAINPWNQCNPKEKWLKSRWENKQIMYPGGYSKWRHLNRCCTYQRQSINQLGASAAWYVESKHGLLVGSGSVNDRPVISSLLLAIMSWARSVANKFFLISCCVLGWSCDLASNVPSKRIRLLPNTITLSISKIILFEGWCRVIKTVASFSFAMNFKRSIIFLINVLSILLKGMSRSRRLVSWKNAVVMSSMWCYPVLHSLMWAAWKGPSNVDEKLGNNMSGDQNERLVGLLACNLFLKISLCP